MLQRDLIAERKRDTLRLRADSDEATDLTVVALDRNVYQRVFAEHGLGVQVGGQKPAFAIERARRSEALHIRASHDMIQILANVGDVCAHGNLVLPLEFSPHASKHRVAARRGDDVIHDINVHVVQHDDITIGASGLVHDVAEDDSRFGRAHLDARSQVVRTERW